MVIRRWFKTPKFRSEVDSSPSGLFLISFLFCVKFFSRFSMFSRLEFIFIHRYRRRISKIGNQRKFANELQFLGEKFMNKSIYFGRD